MDCEENPDRRSGNSRSAGPIIDTHARLSFTQRTQRIAQICDAIWLPVDTSAPAPSNFFDAFFDAFRAASG